MYVLLRAWVIFGIKVNYKGHDLLKVDWIFNIIIDREQRGPKNEFFPCSFPSFAQSLELIKQMRFQSI